jgi:uncharacterized membrane protein
VIGLYWLAHWRRSAAVRSADERLVVINLVLLGFIGLIPFPTSLLALVSTALVNLAWLLVFPAQAWVLRLMRTEESGGEP